MHKSPMIRMMEDAVMKAGKAIARDFGEVENLQVSKKGPRDFVTSADLRADKILREELTRVRPHYSFLTEESGYIKGQDEAHCWIIDPVDGTTNFMHGIPHFCISLALQETKPNGKKEIVAGIVFAPALQELYWAERGQGAYLHNRRLQVSGRDNLSDALVAIYPSREDARITHKLVDAVETMGCTMRNFGAAALDLAYVASGRLDGFFHPKLKSWDMAAGILIVREARGMVTDAGGGDTMFESGQLLATNQHLNDEMRRLLVGIV